MKNNDQSTIGTTNPKRNKYSAPFKEQALVRAKQDGVFQGRQRFSYSPGNALYNWQVKSFSKQKSPGLSEQMHICKKWLF